MRDQAEEQRRHFFVGLFVLWFVGAMMTAAYYKNHRAEPDRGELFSTRGEQIVLAGAGWPIYWSWRLADSIVAPRCEPTPAIDWEYSVLESPSPPPPLPPEYE